jgi:hypothetical protein
LFLARHQTSANDLRAECWDQLLIVALALVVTPAPGLSLTIE